MMQGYDRQEALDFIVKRIHPKDHPELAERIPALVEQAIDADMAFMHETGVLDDEGNSGGEYYEEDDAFEYIVEALAAQNRLSPEEAVKAASLVDDFMDAQQAYMEYRGLVATDD